MAFEEYKGSDGVKNQSTVSGDTVSDALETLDVAITAEDIWDRTGTTIEPKNAGDDLDIGTGSITANSATLDGGTNTFSITNGTASLDVAAGATLDVNANLTVESASAVNQDLTTDAIPLFSNLNIGDGLSGVKKIILNAGTDSRIVYSEGGTPYFSAGFDRSPNADYFIGTGDGVGNKKFVLRNNGNVGIGDDIVNPSAKIDIVVADTHNVPALELNNNDTTNNPDTLVIANTTSGADTNINGLKTIEDSIDVADDGTITLPTGVAGMLHVWEDIEWIHCHITSAGVVTSINGSTNSAATDSDGNLCVYDGGTGAIIKNRLGSQKTIRYSFKYS